MRVVPDRRSSARSCAALFTTVLISRSVRSAGTWRAKVKRLPTKVFVRRAWARIFEAGARGFFRNLGVLPQQMGKAKEGRRGVVIFCGPPAGKWAPRKNVFHFP